MKIFNKHLKGSEYILFDFSLKNKFFGIINRDIQEYEESAFELHFLKFRIYYVSKTNLPF